MVIVPVLCVDFAITYIFLIMISAVLCEIKQCDISKLIIKEPNIGNVLINVFFASNCINELGNKVIEKYMIYLESLNLEEVTVKM